MPEMRSRNFTRGPAQFNFEAPAFTPWPADEYREVNKLADAIHGEVCLYKHLPSGEERAVKKIQNDRLQFPDRYANSCSTVSENPKIEINVMNHLTEKITETGENGHIVKFINVHQDKNYTYVVSEYASQGELFLLCKSEQEANHIKGADRGFTEAQGKMYGCQILAGIETMHRYGVVSRDVSLENVLINGEGNVLLTDFGQAVPVFDRNQAPGTKATYTGLAGKETYRAPEMYEGSYFAEPVDMFALGAALFTLVVGTKPWDKARNTDQSYRYLSVKGLKTGTPGSFKNLTGAWGVPISTEFDDLLTGLLNPDPSKRLTIADAKKHPWFGGAAGSTAPSTTLTLSVQVEQSDTTASTSGDALEECEVVSTPPSASAAV